MMKDYFVKQSIKSVEIEEFIRQAFPLGDYSKTEIQRTPLGIKVIIHTNKPGRIIGRAGKNINEMTEALKNRFNLENPQLDVKSIDNPNLDAKIVAKQISSALEKGYNYKKIGNLTVKRVMGSGAIGVQIIISGKLGGGKGLTSKFTEGYIKYAGHPVEELVDEGFEEANTRPGKIGVRVRILKEFIDISGEKRNYVEKAHETLRKELDEAAKKIEETEGKKAAPKEAKKTKKETKEKAKTAKTVQKKETKKAEKPKEAKPAKKETKDDDKKTAAKKEEKAADSKKK
ncbi:MAG: 30S ribosomal protein S3 [Candidatus Aenigmatarchaeota archaeon]|nr:MAG: 30S ribosomal protein S3 [Candidatus Aenigmarchaeota archaeon]